MAEIVLTVWLIGTATCLGLALTHPGTWPYTKGGYANRRRQMLTRFWVGVLTLAVVWPLAVVGAGLKAVWEDLT